ncbi:hypothetical protein BY458DRAFT_511864 [Sporodiniella umbellata]|nr:hypothetical protein BY458DRAFT_511864 [Sporodiniella umbellata]
MQSPDSTSDRSSEGTHHRIEPSFFHTSNTQREPGKKGELGQGPAENPYWSSPPPYYSSPPPRENDTPSAPPLELPQPYPSQAYPPLGYNAPYYGSTPPIFPNTSDAPLPSPIPAWPWAVPPAPSSTGPNEGKRSSFSLSDWIIYILIGFFVFCGVMSMVGSNASFRCTNAVPWTDLPEKVHFGPQLTISSSRGISAGRVILQDATEQTPQGTVHIKGLISSGASAQHVRFHQQTEGEETRLEFEINRDSILHFCVSLEIVIYVAQNTSQIAIDLPNVAVQIPGTLANTDSLRLTTTNAPIQLDSPWRGQNLYMSTTNAQIQLSKPVLAQASVTLTTTNGAIISTSQIDAHHRLRVTTTNALIHLHQIKTDGADLHTSNGAIILDHAMADTYLSAITTNGKMNLHLLGEKNPQVTAKTSNGYASISLPESFEGSFSAQTSSHNTISLHDRLAWTNVKHASRGMVVGERSRYTSTNPHGSILLESSNADLNLEFVQEE